MEASVLSVINEEMTSLGLAYEYGEFAGKLTYPYIVGEFSEDDYIFEDNSTGGEMILTAFNRGKEIDLISIKEAIKKKFRDYRKTVDGGTMSIVYERKLFIRSGEDALQKMEIRLTIKYWEGV